MSSDPTTQPGQKKSEVPFRARDDTVVMVFWAGFMLLFPFLWIDSDKPLHKRFWAWRYIYLGFTVFTAVFFLPQLLAGEFIWLAIAPFAHLLAVGALLSVFVGFQLPGLTLPAVSYDVTAGLFAGSIVAVGGGDILRRTSPAMFTRDPYDASEDELVVPFRETAEKSNDATTPPKLDQRVSTAVIGETGSGKTSAMQLLAYQFQYHRDTAVIAHDAGEDFQQFYEDLGFEVLRISDQNGTVTWNLFKDADSRKDFREIAGAIFGEPDGHDPFHRPAKQVFVDLLMYLHLEAKKNERRHALSHSDIVSLLGEGRGPLYKKLSEYDERLDPGHIDINQGKSARNVYQTLRENVRPVFVDGFAEYGEFSLQEYIENPDGRVLIIDSNPLRMETLGPMYQLLLDWSIRYAMVASNPTVHVLDEIDQLPPLSQVTNLAARGRKEKARALIGVQTVGQLEDTYNNISGIFGNSPQGLYFGPGDQESTEHVLNELGEQRVQDRQEMIAVSRSSEDNSQREQMRERRQERDKTALTSAQLRSFETGECIAVCRTDWWYGHIHELHEVRSNLPDWGVESPPSLEDTDSTDSDSWLSFVSTKLGRSEGETSESDSVSADPVPESQDSREQPDASADPITDPAVWAADGAESPDLSFTQSRWDTALDRLDLEQPPISEPKHIDAFEDICSMLDDRILSLQAGADAPIEIKELLIDLQDQTGLAPQEVLNEVTANTEALQMSDQFRTEFLEQVDDQGHQETSDERTELNAKDNTGSVDAAADPSSEPKTDPDEVTDESESGGSTEVDSDQQSAERDTSTRDDEPAHNDEDMEKLSDSDDENDDTEDTDEFGASDFM